MKQVATIDEKRNVLYLRRFYSIKRAYKNMNRSTFSTIIRYVDNFAHKINITSTVFLSI